jgi:hypothetical protein
MAWSFANFASQPTAALRLSVLLQHISEVEAAVDAGVSSDGQSIDPGPLNDKLTRLYAERDRLEANPLNMTGGGVSRIRITDPR